MVWELKLESKLGVFFYLIIVELWRIFLSSSLAFLVRNWTQAIITTIEVGRLYYGKSYIIGLWTFASFIKKFS